MTDNEIINEVLNADKNAFRFLVERYQQLVFRTAIGFLHDSDKAADLTQEVFIQAYLALHRFRGDSSFSTWLYRITVNASLNKIRKSSVKKFTRLFEISSDPDPKSLLTVTDPANPEETMIRNENIEMVRKALDSLPEKQRIAIVLGKYDGLSQKEIAEIMNTTEGAVESLLQRAKMNLRKKLSGYETHIIKNHKQA